MTDKIQKRIAYVSGSNVIVYETLQYNADSWEWYIVGDSSLNKTFIDSEIARHNAKL